MFSEPMILPKELLEAAKHKRAVRKKASSKAKRPSRKAGRTRSR